MSTATANTIHHAGEEQSNDVETTHLTENVDLAMINDQPFAQTTSINDFDPI